jgi:hypothetical protein
MTTNLLKVCELTGAALDWAVAKAEEERDVLFCQRQYGRLLVRIAGDHETRDVEWPYAPSTDWSQGGPIIEREGISVVQQGDAADWVASVYNHNEDDWYMHTTGPTPLIAAMRCYVASKLGDDVDVPEELVCQ